MTKVITGGNRHFSQKKTAQMRAQRRGRAAHVRACNGGRACEVGVGRHGHTEMDWARPG